MAQSNFYNLLGVAREATTEEIKKAYKRAALTHHPDKGGDPEKFKECGAALETLTDDRKRAGYDHMLNMTRSQDGRQASRDSRESRSNSHSRPPAAPAPQMRPTPSTGSTAPRPPRPAAAAVEIPSDPSGLSIKELKELLSALAIDHEGCLEKADLLDLLQARREKRPGRDTTPRSTPRQEGPDETSKSTERRPSNGGTTNGGNSGKGGRAIRIKVMSLGAAGSGKSTLIKRYCEGRFVPKYITTIGIDYGVKVVQSMGHDVKVNFFDTSGGDEFQEIRVEFYSNTSGVLLVYDVTNRKSFTELDSWLAEARQHGCSLSKPHRNTTELPFVILCANKIDLPRRCVSKQEGQDFASKHGFKYFETSANSGDQVLEAMASLFDGVVSTFLENRKRLAAGG